MGMIRGSLLVIVSILLFASFLIFNSLMVVENSLEYNNIKTQLIPVLTESLDKQIGLNNLIANNYFNLSNSCANQSEVVLGAGGDALEINCSVVSQGPDAIKNKIIDDSLNKVYYAEYDCKFLDCNKNGDKPFFIVSEHSKNYFKSWMIKSLILSIVLAVLVLFIVETISNGFIISGVLLLVSALLVRFSTSILLKIIFSPMAQKFGIDILEMFGFLLSSLNSVFVKCLIASIVLIAIGIIWKIFALGFKIKGFFDGFSSGSKKKDKKEKDEEEEE